MKKLTDARQASISNELETVLPQQIGVHHKLMVTRNVIKITHDVKTRRVFYSAQGPEGRFLRGMTHEMET
jgi:hypothetical protein